jgi:mycothiol synthase
MVRIESRSTLDAHVLDEILGLIETATAIEGHRPVGEHKYSHLRVGARAWTGVLAYDDARRLVGYVHTRWNPAGERPRMAVEVVVHPDQYTGDVARRLVEESCAVLAAAGGGTLWLWVHRVVDPSQTLAAKMGFGVQRALAFMQRDLADRPQPAPPLEGVTIRPYRGDVDDEAFLRVNNAAFEGHPENGAWDLAEFRARRDRDWFDPDGLLLAWRGDELLAFHWTKRHAHDSDEVPAHEPVGEVYVLGVHPDAQGLGLGRLLLDAGLAYLYDRDCRLAVLYVDCANRGAVRLYEREGFEILYQEVCYETTVAASGDRHDFARPA